MAGYFNLPSYLLSRFAFIGTHLVFAYWVNFLLNDPFNLGTNTLDPKIVLPHDKCNNFIKENVIFDLGLFTLWWASHSIPARKVVKTALGLWEHPVERPLFATIAVFVWGLNVLLWRPISNCSKWDPLSLGLKEWSLPALLITLATALVVGFLWYLPDHVFGTARYQYQQGELPKGQIIRGFPYGLVRHPAATGFLWTYWALPAYTPNHLFLASLWTVFIVVGTLIFEEGGLKTEDEFGKNYAQYRANVPAFYPTIAGLKAVFGNNKKSV